MILTLKKKKGPTSLLGGMCEGRNQLLLLPALPTLVTLEGFKPEGDERKGSIMEQRSSRF